MLIIDFTRSAKNAFIHGFQKGVASPFILHGHFMAPGLPAVEQITVPNISNATAVEQDWQAIGMDIRKAVELYGKTAA